VIQLYGHYTAYHQVSGGPYMHPLYFHNAHTPLLLTYIIKKDEEKERDERLIFRIIGTYFRQKNIKTKGICYEYGYLG
jgi:hypothetical protein